MEGMKIPENVDVWGSLSPKVKMDLVAIARLARKSVKRIMVESILTAGILTDIEGPGDEEYNREYEEAKGLKDEA